MNLPPMLSLKLVTDKKSPFAKTHIQYDGTPESVLPLLKHILGGSHCEQHVVVLLDHAHRVIGAGITGIGTLTEVSARPREVFKLALVANAYAVITVHTHPGHSPQPSEPDRKVYATMREASHVVGVFLEDDLILAGNGRFFSFNNEHRQKVRRKLKKTRDRAVARSAHRRSKGAAFPRDVVLLAANDIYNLPALLEAERVATIARVIAEVEPIVLTSAKIRHGTRQRAEQILSLAKELLPGAERGEFPPIGRIDAVLGIEVKDQPKTVNYPLIDFVEIPVR